MFIVLDEIVSLNYLLISLHQINVLFYFITERLNLSLFMSVCRLTLTAFDDVLHFL